MGFDYSVEEIDKKLRISIEIFYKNDWVLIENNVSERSISHKLAEYLQVEFKDWNVDCEYNRKNNDIKKLEGISECSEQRATDRIYPDIIVHERNLDKNLVVIEVKSSADEETCDIEKLKKLTSTKYDFHYKVGYFIRFSHENGKYQIRRFRSGREVS